MLNSNLKMIMALLLSSFSGIVSADFYVGGSAGSTEYPRLADNVNSYELSAGIRFSDIFGVEIAWLELGEVAFDRANNAKNRFGIDGTSVSFFTFLPLAPDVELFGKFGMYYWDIETDLVTSQALIRSNNDERDSDLIIGGGLVWHLSDNISLRGQYQQVDVAGDNIENTSLGITYSF